MLWVLLAIGFATPQLRRAAATHSTIVPARAAPSA